MQKKFRHYLKPLIHRIYQPMLARYLASERKYRYRQISLSIKPGVFHPGLFFSTKLLIHFLEKQALGGKSFLELGAGSGLISIFAAKQGAIVTASDINPAAIANIEENALQNQVELRVLTSDLFTDIPRQIFNWIVINPPYYPKNPENDSDHAWFCGAEFEYFRRLFPALQQYMNSASFAIMILSEDCELETIQKIAGETDHSLKVIFQKSAFGEMNYIFRIEHRA